MGARAGEGMQAGAAAVLAAEQEMGVLRQRAGRVEAMGQELAS